MSDTVLRYIEAVASHPLPVLGKRTALIGGLPLGRFAALPIAAIQPTGLAALDPDDAALWQFLLTNGASDEVAQRYLAQMDDRPLDAFEMVLRRGLSISNCLRDDVSGGADKLAARDPGGLVLPERLLRREDRPIVLRSATIDLGRHRSAAAELVPPSKADASIEDQTSDLSAALIACLAEDKVHPAPTRTRRFGERRLWGCAAALTAVAVISAYAVWPGSRDSSGTAADASAANAPSSRDRVANLASKPDPVAPRLKPAEMTRVASAAPHVPSDSARIAPIQTPPTTMAIAASARAIVAKPVEPVHRETKFSDGAVSTPINAVSSPILVANVATTPANVSAMPHAVDAPLATTHPTKRKTRRAAAKRTSVASALALPESLKPQ